MKLNYTDIPPGRNLHLPLLLAVFLLALGCGEGTEHTWVRATSSLNIRYGAEVIQAVDIHTPEGIAPFPVVFHIHGGGWFEGDRTECNQHKATILSKGYALACVGYRLGVRFPAASDDVQAAATRLVEHADAYNLDSNRFYTMGHSAGGHLAALLGATASGVIRAVASFSAPTDFLLAPPKQDGGPYQDFVACLEKALGGPVADHLELAKKMSPATHITENSPAFWISHGLADSEVPPFQATVLNQRLMANSVPTTLGLLPVPAGHEQPTQNQIGEALEFFDQH